MNLHLDAFLSTTMIFLSSTRFIRRQIGIVPQDSLLFEGSIRDNISLISPDATFEDIVQAAKVACAHEFIMEQPDGYASRVASVVRPFGWSKTTYCYRPCCTSKSLNANP